MPYAPKNVLTAAVKVPSALVWVLFSKEFYDALVAKGIRPETARPRQD